jgi:Zn-dependent M28 family amino/carboxypeptidase
MSLFKKHMLPYLITIILLLLFFIWAYFTMVNIRPITNKRPKINKDANQIIYTLESRLRRHVVFLAQEIGERNVSLPANLNKAADYIHKYWQENGYEVKLQTYPVFGVECVNLSVEIPGKEKPAEIILIGAHYDSVNGSPGANDNGSAVAALLEISRLFNQRPQKRTVRFVAFANEEPPFYHTKWMGSYVYARLCREQGENILGMLSLETIGYYSEQPKSQKYPPPLSLFYPDRGNFIAVVGNLKSKQLVKTFTKYFKEEINFPVECIATFGLIPGISWSDHSSFWKYDYPAIMITDTALYRYPFYHTYEDTPDKIHYSKLSLVTYGIFCAVKRLAEQE